MAQTFDDRRHAGRVLAELLTSTVGPADEVIVLALPRGGVPVAFEVATRLQAPLDVVVVRKLGLPGHEELAMGALASGGTTILNRSLVAARDVPEDAVRAVIDRERHELARREREYRDDRPSPRLAGRTVVIVDDGLATGSTMRAAVAAVGEHGPARVVAAVPAGAPESCAELREVADDVVCASEPRAFAAVGQWYRDFTQTTDDEVRELLSAARGNVGTNRGTVEALDIRMRAGGVELAGNLAVPSEPSGVVLFAHGSGSSRNSPRNRLVAERLQAAGLATFLVDLLTDEEEQTDLRTRAMRFDIELLADRLEALGEGLAEHPSTAQLPLGLFGASTGGGAALVAAARRPDLVGAVVSRGGRPDLAGALLADVRAPTLLVVGGRDEAVVAMNDEALASMHGPHRLELVPGATHLFEEPGALDAVARLAREWFVAHLSTAAARSRR